MNKFILGSIGALALAVGALAGGDYFGSDQTECVIAQCLPGTWKLNGEFSRLLDPKPDVLVANSIVFEKQEGVLKVFREQYPRFMNLEGKVYMEGSATLNETDKHFFFVFTDNGNNQIVLFTPTRRGGAVDPHPLLVNLVVSRDCQKDLLFIGGSYARDSASVYNRSSR